MGIIKKIQEKKEKRAVEHIKIVEDCARGVGMKVANLGQVITQLQIDITEMKKQAVTRLKAGENEYQLKALYSEYQMREMELEQSKGQIEMWSNLLLPITQFYLQAKGAFDMGASWYGFIIRLIPSNLEDKLTSINGNDYEKVTILITQLVEKLEFTIVKRSKDSEAAMREINRIKALAKKTAEVYQKGFAPADISATNKNEAGNTTPKKSAMLSDIESWANEGNTATVQAVEPIEVTAPNENTNQNRNTY